MKTFRYVPDAVAYSQKHNRIIVARILGFDERCRIYPWGELRWLRCKY